MAGKRDSNVPSIVPRPATRAEQTKLRKRNEIGNTIRSLRLARGLTQPQLAAMLGITTNAVTNWEAGASRPNISTIAKLCNALGCSANALFGLPEEEKLQESESEILELYRSISPSERRTIKLLMESMLSNRAEDLREECRRNFVPVERNELRYSAGTGNPLDDSDGEKTYEYLRICRDVCLADGIITVSGDSMAPTFQDGDDLLVQRAESVKPGEIGLFIVAGEGFVKEYRPDGLHSHNPKYKTIHPMEDDNARCIGRVLSVVTGDMRPSAQERCILDELAPG